MALSRTSPTVAGIVPPQLLVGIETADDAAVYRISDEQALIATTDFFMPIVDDPYDFGRIAATNAISDVYAMGGTPIMALALLAMPVNQLPLEVIRRIVEGGQSVCSAAGIPIAGGHTIDSVEPIDGYRIHAVSDKGTLILELRGDPAVEPGVTGTLTLQPSQKPSESLRIRRGLICRPTL